MSVCLSRQSAIISMGSILINVLTAFAEQVDPGTKVTGLRASFCPQPNEFWYFSVSNRLDIGASAAQNHPDFL
jgi:hypothetical protein